VAALPAAEIEGSTLHEALLAVALPKPPSADTDASAETQIRSILLSPEFQLN